MGGGGSGGGGGVRSGGGVGEGVARFGEGVKSSQILFSINP